MFNSNCNQFTHHFQDTSKSIEFQVGGIYHRAGTFEVLGKEYQMSFCFQVLQIGKGWLWVADRASYRDPFKVKIYKAKDGTEFFYPIKEAKSNATVRATDL